MSHTRFSGRTAAEAAIRACEELGCTRSELKYEVVVDEGEGLARRVTIEVAGEAGRRREPAAAPRESFVRPPAQAPSLAADEDEDDEEPPRRDEVASESRPSGRGGRGGRGRSSNGDSGRGGRGGRGNRGGDGGSGGGQRGGRRPAEGRSESRGEPRGNEGGRGRQQQSAEGGRSRRPQRQAPGIDALLELREPGPEMEPLASIEPSSPRSTKAVEVVRKLVELMDFVADVSLVREDEAEIHVHIRGQDEKAAVGQRGEVLLALQFLANRLLGRAENEDEADQVLVLDAGGHRERRHHAIVSLARSLAERALKEGKGVRLSPMSAHDRRIFHLALQDMEGITTQSEGDGVLRNLLIVPAALVEG